jgi:hypothetical protein
LERFGTNDNFKLDEFIRERSPVMKSRVKKLIKKLDKNYLLNRELVF